MLECASAAPGEEVCGLVGALHGAPASYYPVENRAENRASRYLMDPQQQIDVMRTMRSTGQELFGIFHSHPDSPPVPSEIDREMAAYPGVVYFIASTRHPVPELCAYVYENGDFEPLNLQ